MSESERPEGEEPSAAVAPNETAAEKAAESAPEAKADAAPDSAPDAPTIPPAAPAPRAEVDAQAQAEVARMRDQLLRTAADFDNFRKRSRRETEDAQRRGKESVLKEILPVFDNLERAATHADGAADAKSVADGLRIVLKQFFDTVNKLGVRRVPAVGEPFDPTMHEAIQHLESAEHPSGHIVAEIQAGYMIGEQLLRAAMVVVSKGPPTDASTPS